MKSFLEDFLILAMPVIRCLLFIGAISVFVSVFIVLVMLFVELFYHYPIYIPFFVFMSILGLIWLLGGK